MKIQVRVRQIAEALLHIKSAVQPINYALAPSNHVYLTAIDKILKIRASNGTDTIEVTIPADVEKAGKATFPLEQLSIIACNAPGEKILALEIPKHEICRYAIYPHIKGRLESICQIPSVEEFNNAKYLFNVEEKILKTRIEDVLHFAGKGSLERLWNYCIAFRRTQNADIELAAGSNGSVVYNILPVPNSISGDILLFAPSLRRLSNLLENNGRSVSCAYHEESQSLIFRMLRLDAVFITKIQNDNFPDLDNYFPKEYEVIFKVQVEQLREALTLAKAYYPQDTDTLTLRIVGNALLVEAFKPPIGEISIAVPCTIERTPEKFQMSVNAHRLSSVVFNVDFEKIKFQVRIRNNHLLMITPEDEGSNRTLKYVIIP